MKRRTFLQSSAALPLLAQAKTIVGETAIQNQSRLSGEPAPIDWQVLKGRNQRRSSAVGQKGMVASSQALASSVGLDILRQGGSAIDAAIAMNAMLSLTEPAMCGPGGDLFAIVWSEQDQKLHGLNASGRSPYGWSRMEAAKRGFTQALPILGPLTWSVPGCVSGWDALHSKLGKLAWNDLFAPAIDYAHNGFMVQEIMASDWQSIKGKEKDHPTAFQTYTVDGQIPTYGHVFRNPDLGKFFETIAKQGAQSFYQGEIAERIVQYSKERGGVFSMKDFADHKATWVDPVSTSYRGYDVWEIPPNGQGIAALQMLNMLETFDLASLSPNSAEQLHLFIEAKKLAFEDRAIYYADMDHADVPLDWLVSKEYGKERAKLIDPNKASTDLQPGALDGSKDTIYCCASDSEGNMISLIQSIYYGWGSLEVPAQLGFCLQNRGRSFSLDPKRSNTLEPHKRPFHTIIPGFLTKGGKPKAAFGVMGGDFQPQGHVQVLMNMLDFGMSPQQAGEQPRLEHIGSTNPWGEKTTGGGNLSIESGMDEETIFGLIKMGHVISSVGDSRQGGYQCIWREEDPQRYFGGSDARKDGLAIGY